MKVRFLSRDKMAKKKEVTLQQRKDYLEFLEKRLNSENYKKSVTEEEYKKQNKNTIRKNYLSKCYHEKIIEYKAHHTTGD
jgi:hypothetical protein